MVQQLKNSGLEIYIQTRNETRALLNDEKLRRNGRYKLVVWISKDRKAITDNVVYVEICPRSEDISLQTRKKQIAVSNTHHLQEATKNYLEFSFTVTRYLTVDFRVVFNVYVYCGEDVLIECQQVRHLV